MSADFVYCGPSFVFFPVDANFCSCFIISPRLPPCYLVCVFLFIFFCNQVDYIRNSSTSTTPTATPPASVGIPSPMTVPSPGPILDNDADSVHGSVLGPTPSSSFEDLITSILHERNKDLGESSRLKVQSTINLMNIFFLFVRCVLLKSEIAFDGMWGV